MPLLAAWQMILSRYTWREKGSIPPSSTSPVQRAQQRPQLDKARLIFTKTICNAVQGGRVLPLEECGLIRRGREQLKNSPPSTTPLGSRATKGRQHLHTATWSCFFQKIILQWWRRGWMPLPRTAALAALPYSWFKSSRMLRMWEVSLAHGQDSAHCPPTSNDPFHGLCVTQYGRIWDYGARRPHSRMPLPRGTGVEAQLLPAHRKFVERYSSVV